MLLLSSIGSRGFVLGASALVHVAVFAVAAHGSNHADGLALTAITPDVESEITIDENRDPISEREATHANHVHTHTHAYPVSPDHDLIDHDPSIVHTPYAPHDHDEPADAPADSPADGRSDIMTAPASAPAALPNFSISIGSSTTSHGLVQTGGTGSGAAANGDAESPVEEDHVSSAAHLVQTVLPAYPADAREEGIEADVPLEIIVDKNGAVKSVSPLAPAGYGFDEAAASAIRHYRFSPATREGHAVASAHEVDRAISFEIKRAKDFAMTSTGDSLTASQALLAAAIGGLLCLTTACSSGSSTAPETDEDTPQPATTCSNRASDTPTISSSTVEPSDTQDKFSSDCAAQNGIMEIQPNCGGSNACRGMSYDNAKQLLTEHNCRAVNTCAGYSCVICD